MRFHNREDAAGRLATRLEHYREQHPVVLGIPRSGVPVARLIADRLDADLDVILVRKLRAPFDPQRDVGSIDEAGHVYLSPGARTAPLDERAFDEERGRQLMTLHQMRSRYSASHAPVDIAGRTVIIVDDGFATGSAATAAVRAASVALAKHIVLATAVAPPETINALRGLANDVVCLETPVTFTAVGEYFDEFPDVTDGDVIELLTARPRRMVASSSQPSRTTAVGSVLRDPAESKLVRP
jgi:putative phosphoribosyl transferase